VLADDLVSSVSVSYSLKLLVSSRNGGVREEDLLANVCRTRSVISSRS
jgi:hypothetical protein